MSKTDRFIIFALGAAVGSVVTWQYTKRYYERRAQEEIDSVKETFSKMRTRPINRDGAAEKDPKEDTTGDQAEKKSNISRYTELLKQEKYVTNDPSPVAENRPYVISPDEFGEFEEYDQISLTYYADQVLADENNDKIKDVDEVVGIESLTHFGEYEDDSVFVRNDQLKCDYEILMDERTYSEILKQKPHQREE